MGDRLLELDRYINWSALVALADGIWRANGPSKASCGAKPWSSEVMLRVIVLKRLYNLSDEQAEYQLRDRISFMRFVGLGLGDGVPDSRTIWLYSQALAKADGARRLFECFQQQLQQRGLLVKEGAIVDATFVEVPRQRNSREENALVKTGEVPQAWEQQPRKLAQKDTDARWAKKGDATFFGYKNHVKVGRKTKLIKHYVVTAASTNDGQVMPELASREDPTMHADAAYTGVPIAEDLKAKGVRNCIHEKGQANAPLTCKQKASNRRKSKVRARVEHVFAFMETSLGSIYQRCIGALRNQYQIGLMNLCYNLCRTVQILSGRAAVA
jgi:IS5 family transposase